MTYTFKIARRNAGTCAPVASRRERVRVALPSSTRLLLWIGVAAIWACGSEDSTAPATPAEDTPAVSAEGAQETPELAGSATQITILPGQSIQAKVNSYPAGTRFLLKAGTYYRQSVSPKSGNAFIGEPGAILDGQGATAYAFRGASGARGVRIQGLIIQKYKPPVQMAPVRADGTTGWVIQDNEIRNNATGGLRFGDKTQVLQNYIHHNGQIGIVGVGDSVLIQGNEIAYNNYLKEYKFGFELGGAKFVKTRYLVARDNHVHHNEGNGLWSDNSNIYTLYENNTLEDNSGAGIFHEISFNATIRNNIARRNGFARGWVMGAGILISASSNVEIYGNQVLDNKQGIIGIQQHRIINGVSFDKNLKNFYAHDNTVRMPSGGLTGITQDIGDLGVYTNRNNRFQSNHYDLGSDTTPFWWKSKSLTVAQWRADGQDASGTFY